MRYSERALIIGCSVVTDCLAVEKVAQSSRLILERTLHQ